MNQEQRDIAKAHILADPALVPMTTGETTDYAALIAAMDVPSAKWVRRTRVTKDDIYWGAGPDGTTFSWSLQGGYISRSPGELNAWQEMFASDAGVDPNNARVRAAFDDIFSGSGQGAQNNRAHILGICRRLATRLESLFANGGPGTTVSPATLSFEGSMTFEDCNAMFNPNASLSSVTQ